MKYLLYKSIKELEYELDVTNVSLDHVHTIGDGQPHHMEQDRQHFTNRRDQIKALLEYKKQEINGK